MSDFPLTSVLRSDLSASPAGTGVQSVLAIADRGAGYDRIAGTYDRIVGNRLYNRVVWGVSTKRYEEEARLFLKAVPEGAILDFGCGTLVFSHCSYARNAQRIILFDRSLGMLGRAVQRLPDGIFLQGDAIQTPFVEGAFAGAMSWGMLHIFGSSSQYLDNLVAAVAPGGLIALSSLVLGDRPIGDRMLKVLHARGEAAKPETAADILDALSRVLVIQSHDVCGNMLFVRARKPLREQSTAFLS